jgi:hypothetical protein
MIDDDDDALIATAGLVAEHFPVTSRTIATWEDDPEMDFAPIRIRGRKYHTLGQVRKLKRFQKARAKTKGNAGWQAVQGRPRDSGRFSTDSGSESA